MKDYFYIDSRNQQHGPIAEDKLLAEGIQRQTLVWCQGMENWMPAETVPELEQQFCEAEKQQENKETDGRTSPNEPPPYQKATQSFSQQPQYNSYMNNRPPFPDTYMVWAVLSTICCCLPLGIVAIIKANQVSGLYYRGLYDEAYLTAEDAKKWSIAAFAVGLITCCTGGFMNLFFGCSSLADALNHGLCCNIFNC